MVDKTEEEFVCGYCSTVEKQFKFKQMIGVIDKGRDHAVCPNCKMCIKQK